MAEFDPARLAKDRVDERAALRRLARFERQARLILAFETLWPSLVAALTLLGAALLLILVGAFEYLPPALRGLSLVAVIGAASALIVRAVMGLRLTREDDLERIDQDTALDHRPALSLADFSAAHLDDPLTFALWRAHREQVVAKIAGLRLSWPHPRVLERDPYAIRFGVLIALIATVIVGGTDNFRRIDTALIWTSAEDAAAMARLDGWIDPPAYTALPPILFNFQSNGESKTVRAPVGSTLVLRRSDTTVSFPDVSSGLLANESKKADDETRFTLNADSTITPQDRHHTAIAIEAIPDEPPSIALLGEPQATASGGVSLAFHVDDDYGIASGSTRIINPRIHGKLLTGAHDPLIAAPNQPIAPSGDKRNSDGRITLEPSDSPWAGATVDMALMVKDDAGQIAEAGLVTLRLPERRFILPVARSLVEERRRLALDPSTLPRVRESIDLLIDEPQLFEIPVAEYLGLRNIRSALDQARSADDLRAALDLIWAVALAIENNGTNDAEKALNAAENALREALQNGASDEEIRALTQKFKDALDAYLKDYAQRAMKQMEQSGQQPNTADAGRSIRPEDLKSMLDRMQDMAKNGARDDAERMLDALSSILKNLQAGQPRMSNPSQSKNGQTAEGLDKMMRDQRGLRDDTYRQGRDNPDAGQQLGNRQQALRGELDQLRDAMKGLGQDGQDALGQAGDAMQRAEDALKQGDIAGALREQNKALEGLRSGAQALAKAMQDESKQGQNGEGQPGTQSDRFGQSSKQDPLGRENGGSPPDDGRLNDGAGQKGASDRARNVLDELRKRLGEDDRTKDERDYYRRLIGPN